MDRRNQEVEGEAPVAENLKACSISRKKKSRGGLKLLVKKENWKRARYTPLLYLLISQAMEKIRTVNA